MANKWVYLFSEGNANMRELLGDVYKRQVLSIMRTAERLMTKFRDRLTSTL